MDDVEMRGGEYSVWWGEGRGDLRSQQAFEDRAGTHHAALHGGIERVVRAGARRAGSGHRHERADHGLGDGHLLDARAAGDYCRGDGQAAGAGRVARPQGSYRAGLDDVLQQRPAEAEHEARGLPRDYSGIWERRLAGGDSDARGRIQNYWGRGYSWRAVQ